MENQCSIRAAEACLRQYGLLTSPASQEVAFTGLSNNSAETKRGDLFICKGFGFKPEYLRDAEKRGAVAYLAESAVVGSELAFLAVSDVRKAQSVLARWFYGNPSDSFTLVGITGTKGKTTTAYDTRAVLNALAGRPTGLVSTTEYIVSDESIPSHLTTPESLTLQKLFASARDHRMPYLTMEVSSQAYRVERVYGEHFNFGVFLNIGADHISEQEHPTMEDYLQCKMQLVQNCDTAIICRKTDYFDRIYAAAKAHAKKVLVIGAACDGCDYTARNIRKETYGFSFDVQEPGSAESFTYHLPQEGRFNVENALAAITIGRECGALPAQIALALENLTVPGRMHMFSEGGLRILVDYVHNRLSFQALFDSLQSDYPGVPLYVVTGNAGNRFPQRRLDVGELCGRYATKVYVSTDDPHFETPESIAEDIARKAREMHHAEVEIIIDRAEAVRKCILEAPEGSIVVLAGKGGETTQSVNGVFEPYISDEVAARQALKERAGK